ncbi:MAG TPA: adenine phosphoribosyltransferase [Candidatus Omnitrophota bacterium]|nr:adenine phosphoribosyltransferase [Candidatus Omnitrophota bacterium]HPB68074.1 adenine phosphoribosyltransferase [Candidatus Omnitrophota bacterium]HQO58819.1 adenine phosphoribosyltransferase [Candidatus Omnitrophota bacterium]HQP11401.1 adenine phosphoribosyltransferase [Candidatus Omnitrophota bacterium]
MMNTTNTLSQRLAATIRDVPDFPKPGILFKDITTLLQDPRAFKQSMDILAKEYKDKKIDAVVAIESRGFIFGSVLAYKLGAAFVPVRKKGKLPYRTKSVTYSLEYGTDTLEMHVDGLKKDARVLIVDDLLATGGTVQAVAKLIKGFKARIVGMAFLVELGFLKGRRKLKGFPVYSVITF